MDQQKASSGFMVHFQSNLPNPEVSYIVLHVPTTPPLGEWAPHSATGYNDQGGNQKTFNYLENQRPEKK